LTSRSALAAVRLATGVSTNARAHGRSPSVAPAPEGSIRDVERSASATSPPSWGGDALAFQATIGRKAIEDRARELTAMVIEGLRKIEGVRIWTHAARERSAAIVSFQPAGLDVRRLHDALYQNDRVVCATRGGSDRPGLRFSPHFYNTHAEVERALAAVASMRARAVTIGQWTVGVPADAGTASTGEVTMRVPSNMISMENPR
jgi:hypothetical protein